MTVQVYRATDPGAPILEGQFDCLFNVLNACLVTGYGDKDAAGWTNPYFDANGNYVLKAGLPGHQFCLRLMDQYTGHENFALMAAFSSMTDLETGLDQTPTVVQSANGVGIRKSSSESATVRDWIIVANQRFFYLIINPDDSSDNSGAECYSFGQFDSFRADDAFNCLISGRNPVDYSSSAYNNLSTFSATNVSVPYHYLMRSYTQVGVSVAFGKHSNIGKNNLPFPNPVDGNLFLDKVFITESVQNCVRGKYPGLWHICHDRSYLNHGDTFTGNGVLTGKSFLIVKVYQGAFALEISNTWD